MRRWSSRFDGGQDGDPMAAMATLVDVMLVFACGLMAALVLGQRNGSRQDAAEGGQKVHKSRALPRPPQGIGDVGGGYRAVGRVFRDRETGKLILVESPGAGSQGAH